MDDKLYESYMAQIVDGMQYLDAKQRVRMIRELKWFKRQFDIGKIATKSMTDLKLEIQKNEISSSSANNSATGRDAVTLDVSGAYS